MRPHSPALHHYPHCFPQMMTISTIYGQSPACQGPGWEFTNSTSFNSHYDPLTRVNSSPSFIREETEAQRQAKRLPKHHGKPVRIMLRTHSVLPPIDKASPTCCALGPKLCRISQRAVPLTLSPQCVCTNVGSHHEPCMLI